MDEIVIPYHISRTFITEHREFNFLFGNDLGQKGILGQAWICYGEPNAFQITTVIRLCPSFRTFFSDNQFEEHKKHIDDSLSKIPRDKPIIPLPKIGEGCSRMKEKAPKLFKYMTEQINKIKYPNIRINYYD